MEQMLIILLFLTLTLAKYCLGKSSANTMISVQNAFLIFNHVQSREFLTLISLDLTTFSDFSLIDMSSLSLS